MIKREIEAQVHRNLAHFPITGIIGPRQVGKTTLAKKVVSELEKAVILLDLELESDLRKLSDPETFLRFHQEKLVVIDEIQRMPQLFSLLRALVDEHRVAGRFLILRSASPSVLRQSSESLAGRIVYDELSPIGLRELPSDILMDKHWLRGGFPEPLLMADDQLNWRWADNFLNTFLERDLRLMGYEITPQAMRRTLQMLTSYHANLLNINELSRSIGLSAPVVARYIDILEGSFFVQKLQPFFANVNKRLVKSPKFYFRDAGLFHLLAGIESTEQLISNRYFGASWEGYVVEQIHQALPERWQLFFYRTHDGAEADLVLQKSGGDLFLIEIKYALSSGTSRGFFETAKDLQPAQKFLIVRDVEPFPKADGTMVCGLRHFLTDILPKL